MEKRSMSTFLRIKIFVVSLHLSEKTDLGRDMLAQDLVLKQYTASLLHPETEWGQVFWQKIGKDRFDDDFLQACFRVWIIPGKENTIKEETIERMENGKISLEKLRLKVLCESDYGLLNRMKVEHANSIDADLDHLALEVFKEHILPQIQNEVSFGPRFGLLRQILSVLIFANWLRDKIGNHLQGFMGTNDTGKFKLDTVDEDVPHHIQQEYIRSFKEGVWQYTRKFFDLEKKPNHN